MPWWKGLFHRPLEALDDPTFGIDLEIPAWRKHLRYHRPDDGDGLVESYEVLLQLGKMQDCVQWQFGGKGLPDFQDAHTVRDLTKPGFVQG